MGVVRSVVYDELRRLAAAKLAAEPAGHTLDATALVHEAYLRLAGATGFATRTQFFRAAAESMRRIPVAHARRKRADKRRGEGKRFELAEGDRVAALDPDTLLAIDEALAQLAAEDPASADVARLRLFGGRDGGRPGRLADDRVPGLGLRPAWLTAALTGE